MFSWWERWQKSGGRWWESSLPLVRHFLAGVLDGFLEVEGPLQHLREPKKKEKCWFLPVPKKLINCSCFQKKNVSPKLSFLLLPPGWPGRAEGPRDRSDLGLLFWGGGGNFAFCCGWGVIEALFWLCFGSAGLVVLPRGEVDGSGLRS